MIRARYLKGVGLMSVVALPLWLPGPWAMSGAALAQGAPRYSAGGSHTCGEGNAARTCIVTGLYFSSCADAADSLRAQDCCRSSQRCETVNGERRCEGSAQSTGFVLTYCIAAPR